MRFRPHYIPFLFIGFSCWRSGFHATNSRERGNHGLQSVDYEVALDFQKHHRERILRCTGNHAITICILLEQKKQSMKRECGALAGTDSSGRGFGAWV
jgi:hypothetical protein